MCWLSCCICSAPHMIIPTAQSCMHTGSGMRCRNTWSAWTRTTIPCRSEWADAPLPCPPAGVEAGTLRPGHGPQGHAAAHAAADVGWRASGWQPRAGCREPESPGARDRARWLCTRHWRARRVRSRDGRRAWTAAWTAAAAAAPAAEGSAGDRRPTAAEARPHSCGAAGAGPGRGQAAAAAAAAAALRCCCCSPAKLLQEKHGACCRCAPAASSACPQTAASGTEVTAEESGAAGGVDQGAQHSAGVRSMVHCVMLQGPRRF